MAIDFLKGLIGFLTNGEQPVEEVSWTSGGVDIPFLPLMEAKTRLRQSQEVSEDPVSWIELFWKGDEASVSHAGKVCYFESFQQETFTNTGTRKKHRILRERSRYFPAELLASLTNQTSQIQVKHLKDGTLGITLYKTSYQGHTSYDENAHIWLEPETLQGTYMEESALDCSV